MRGGALDLGEAKQDAAHREGPRERLLRLGASALTDSELLAVLLGTGTRSLPVQKLADHVLDRSGGLDELLRREPHELCSVRGIGQAKATMLAAALELGRRSCRTNRERPLLQHPHEVFQLVRADLVGARRERFRVLCLNSRRRLLLNVLVGEGSVHSVTVDPREVFAGALTVRAQSIILVHNHPSGDPSPSPEDFDLTSQLVDAAALLRIRVLDHLVVSGDRYESMSMAGVLPRPHEPRALPSAASEGGTP